ncbi:hypothetical protein FDP41_013131 [Naegleria fowleri]|uniref:Uncharacterized protein n=1 Tax=Naegleria fowleri TaxID=5763 RepID=A0A6A5C460_NAEFO|nr:uncharacterized protein FDP41_013131 [Naegleria fowleri]KAF0980648.1 hypothetical protein FDP41_013131 [Naegleria fowleri]
MSANESSAIVFVNYTPNSPAAKKKTQSTTRSSQQQQLPSKSSYGPPLKAVKSNNNNNIMQFFKKSSSLSEQASTSTSSSVLVSSSNVLNNSNPILMMDTISISSSSSQETNPVPSSSVMMMMEDESLTHHPATSNDLLSSHGDTIHGEQPSALNPLLTIGSSISSKSAQTPSCSEQQDSKKRKMIELSSDEEENECTKENIPPVLSQHENVPSVSPKKKKKKKDAILNSANTTTTSVSSANATATTASSTTDSTTSKTPTTVEECQQAIQQLEQEIKQLKPSLEDSKKIRKDDKIRKYLKKFIEFCTWNKEFQSNKNVFPVKLTYINLLVGYCQGSMLEMDDLINDIRSTWVKIANKKSYASTPITEDSLPTMDAFKNAINLHMERKSYGVKDICDMNVWEARKLSTLTSKLGSNAKDATTLAKQMRGNFKKAVDAKIKEITKLNKLKAKLEKASTKKPTKKDQSNASSSLLTSPKKNSAPAVKCKSITLFTQKCKILQQDQVVSAPVCRTQRVTSLEEIDSVMAAQNHSLSIKTVLSEMKERVSDKKKPKRNALKCFSFYGKTQVMKKTEEGLVSKVVTGRKPFVKDPSVTYPEEDDEDIMEDEGEELVLGELDPVDGETLEGEDDEESDEMDFDDEDESMGYNTICADDIIEYEDGKIEHIETADISKKKKKLSDLDPIYEYSNQLKECSFVVDEDFTFDISELHCNHVYWWVPDHNKTQNEKKVKEGDSTTTTNNSSDTIMTSPKKKGDKSLDLTSPKKEDVWAEDVLTHFKNVLATSSSQTDIVKAMAEKYPDLSKNRIHKKIKEVVVKEKREGDSKQRFYMKQ